ncbi:hypothetical protein EES39_07825 [Streptomyces sp. ADI92-24]|nr:hypothetical protein EDD95_0280 [Streptomyces sp. CEV 2-1]RPK49388.1 hypothetical protein EES39_07825 [Streptomyces sp. ADI92-24]
MHNSCALQFRWSAVAERSGMVPALRIRRRIRLVSGEKALRAAQTGHRAVGVEVVTAFAEGCTERDAA